ncbi:LysR substrate-binding domain-containing protein [Szabonella alba]|uniref:LysR family transcriptional regulator n=1 Tax=Szabonella alba TaxID=2804194 RepID=A0A8K0XYY9_9RHOB|nr:LysR substrate-binding domain-containing protein [Szabonella alba]MBL4916246.1 LysR family transcriptional regulator [Szabonella alba]
MTRRNYTPTLPELQAFAACARQGTATRAGAELGLTQSAISRALGSLEARLGVALFHRIRQRLALSDAGRAFLPEAERLLADLDRAALTVMSFGGHRDVLRLACLPTFATHWLIPRLAGFQRIAPGISFDITATLTAPDFDRDPRDAAILRAGPGAGATLRGAGQDVLLEERLIVVAAPALLPEGDLPGDAALSQLPLLQQATRPDLWLDWFRDAGTAPTRILRGPRFEQFGMVLAAARAGLGVALLPEVLVASDLASGALRAASPRSMVTATPYVLMAPPRSHDLPAFTAFRDWLLCPGAVPPLHWSQAAPCGLDRPAAARHPVAGQGPSPQGQTPQGQARKEGKP